jgi:hypothetical protein
MRVYKLQYDSKEQGFADLLEKGTYGNVEGYRVYINGTQSIKYLNRLKKEESTEEIPVYYDGVFFDVLTSAEIDFGTNEIFPKVCVHSYDITNK